jgi:hypothetical protein
MDVLNRMSPESKYLPSSTQNAQQVSHDLSKGGPVSESRDVQGISSQKVAGAGEGRRSSLNEFKALLQGIPLPSMKHPIFSHDQASLAVDGRLPLSKPSDAHEESVGHVELEKSSKGETAEGAEKTKEESVKDPSTEKSVSGEVLSEEDRQQVEKLKSRDREVRTHEQAHVAAGGQYVRGGISYDYQQGPDGRKYAVGGHVNIDVSEAPTPEQTIVKMSQVRRAALAPAEPSGADRAVASEATKKEQRARSELIEQGQQERQEVSEEVKKAGNEVMNDGESGQEQASADSANASATPDADRSSTRTSRRAQSAPTGLESGAQPQESSTSKRKLVPKPPRVRSHMNLSARNLVRGRSSRSA